MTTITHLEFRRRFTQPEQELSDELEATFETNPMLTPDQKRSLRTGYKNFYAATEVDMSDPAIIPMLWLYEALGILSAGRANQIMTLDEYVDTPTVYTTSTVYLIGGNFVTIPANDPAPTTFDASWSVSPLLAQLIAEGAQIRGSLSGIEIFQVIG
jgi:hypothetical protein